MPTPRFDKPGQGKKLLLRLLAGAAVLGAVWTAQGSANRKVGGYDFTYNMVGEARARPTQVFDDGAVTYFQFAPKTAVPAVFEITPTGPVLRVAETDGPYQRVPGVAAKYWLRSADGTVVEVSYQGARDPGQYAANPGATASAAAVGAGAPDVAKLHASLWQRMQKASLHAQNSGEAFGDPTQPRIAVDVNSYATPTKGDAVRFTDGVVSETPGAGAVGVAAGTYSVPFAVGSTKVGPQGQAAIKGLLREFRSGHTVDVVGQQDKSYKVDLAETRAKAVAALLESGGVPSTAIRWSASDAGVDMDSGEVVAGVRVTLRGTAKRPVEAPAGVAVGASRGLDDLKAKLTAKTITPAQAADIIALHRHAATAADANSTVAQPTPSSTSISGLNERPITRWDMWANDGSVEATLRRWAAEAGWHLIWRPTAPVIRVTGDAELVQEGYVAAVDYVLSQARASGYQVKGRAYSNRVLVISAE